MKEPVPDPVRRPAAGADALPEPPEDQFADGVVVRRNGPCDAWLMTNEAVDVAEKLSSFSEYWSPKVVARLNDYEIKVVKVKGEFVWHSHEDTDELFLVVNGELTIQLRNGNVTLSPGQLFVVPRGVEHCPIAHGEVHAVLFEPVGVVNTGNAGGTMTAAYDDSLA